MTKSKKQPKPAAMSPEEFRAILDRNAITQGQAADRLGFSMPTINQWACGRRPISAANASHIRSVLGTRG